MCLRIYMIFYKASEIDIIKKKEEKKPRQNRLPVNVSLAEGHCLIVS